jgi:GxxExxY protein
VRRQHSVKAFYHRGHRGHGEENLNRDHLNIITGIIIDAALKVHSQLGPGLLESAYKACLAYELRKRGLKVETEVPVPIVYDGLTIDLGYRLDLLVEGAVVVEAKALSKVLPVHQSQTLSHLKLGNYAVALLLNFHNRRLKHGITRFVN